MITGTLRSKIDKLWEQFWTGGITNPLTVIEQISFLMFARMLDINETLNEKRAAHGGTAVATAFGPKQQHLRWNRFKHLGGDEMLKVVRDEVFPHFRQVAKQGSELARYMQDAQLLIQRPGLLVSAVNLIDDLPLQSADTKGDLYEYLLSKLTTAGINGQFRTPRHIIRTMVELLEPKPTDRIVDPACGTAGFLVGAMQYLMERYTSPEAVLEVEGQKVYGGDKLQPYWSHVQKDMFYGFDFDSTMLRVAGMNMLLHGIEHPNIQYADTLSGAFQEKYPKESSDFFDLVLANPPFTGSIDQESLHAALIGKVKTKKTELLFVALILQMLKTGGRAAVIVPEGVLFGSSKAHVALRKLLVDDNQLEAVISLPSGVFKPYAGVSTAVLVFTKTGNGGTRDVWFYKVEADGWSLDDKRTPQLAEEKLGPVPAAKLTAEEHAKNSLPDLVARWKEREKGEKENPRTAQSFCISKADIAAQGYDLSYNRYKEVVHEVVEHRSPKELLKELKNLESEIISGINELERALGK